MVYLRSICIVGPCCLSILNVIVCIYLKFPVHPSPLISPLVTISLMSVHLVCFTDRFSCAIT